MLDVMIAIMTIVSCYAGYLVAGRRGWVPQLDFNSYLIRMGLLEDPAKDRMLPEARRERAEEWIKADHTNLSLDLVRDVAFAFPLRVQQLEHQLLSEDTDWQHEKTCTVCHRPVKEPYETRSMYEKRLAEWEDYTQNHREPYTSVENGIEVVTLCGCGHCNGEY